jgi:predicted PurR-regulated permease PerM
VSAPSVPSPSAFSRRLLILTGISAALLLTYLLRGVLVPLFFAFLLAYALDPIVDRIEATGVNRSLAAVLVMSLLAAAGAMVLVLAVPYFADEMRSAGEQIPGQLAAFKDRADPWVWRVFHVHLPRTWGELFANLAEQMRTPGPEVLRGSAVALFGTLNIIMILGAILMVPVFALYLLIDFDRNVARVRSLIPRRWVPLVTSVANEIHHALGGYVRGQIAACIVLATLYATGLKLIDLRLSIPIGVLTGMLAFVPYIGFGLGFTMAASMAVLDWRGPAHLGATVAVMLVVQVLDATLVTPRVVGGSVGLRPIEVLITMMAVATLFGFLGVLLAVPLGAVIKILLKRANEVYLKSDYYTRPPAET